MKNYNKILEAVNRGIKFALDDFEDQEDIQGQTNSKVNNKSNIREYLEWQLLIDKLESETLSKQYIKELAKLSKVLNVKYTVNSTDNLENIISYIDNIDHNANLNWIDTSKLRNMSYFFCKSNFNGDISEWDVSNVENMNSMFYCSSFNQPLNNWDISNVINMESMFENSSFNQDISNWNVDRVRYTRFVFYDCPIKDEYKPNFKYEKL